jgi:hypothetical protein
MTIISKTKDKIRSEQWNWRAGQEQWGTTRGGRAEAAEGGIPPQR